MSVKNSFYFDEHSVPLPDAKILEKASFCLKEHFGFSTSPHFIGGAGLEAASSAYTEMAELLGLEEGDTMHVVSSGAEAINEALFSFYLNTVIESGKNHLVTTDGEEAATLLFFKRLEQLGCAINMLPLNAKGQLSIKDLKEGIKPRTSLFSFAWANALTGVIQPIEEIMQVAKETDVCLHVDATSILGKLPFSFKELAIDYVTIDGARLGAPLGTSLVLVKKGISFAPFVVGKHYINKTGLITLHLALKKVLNASESMTTETPRLRDLFESSLEEKLPNVNAVFQYVERLPNVSTLCFKNIHSDLLMFHLNVAGIYASFGGGSFQKLSSLLKHLEPELHFSAISFAFSSEITEEKIVKAVSLIEEIVLKLMALTKDLSDA